MQYARRVLVRYPRARAYDYVWDICLPLHYCAGLAVATNWAANFIIGVSVPPMIENIGYGTYIFFACWCCIAAVFSYFFVPETTDLTLEQIDSLFKDNSGGEETALREEVAQEVLKA